MGEFGALFGAFSRSAESAISPAHPGLLQIDANFKASIGCPVLSRPKTLLPNQ